MRFSPPLQVLERVPGGEVSESPDIKSISDNRIRIIFKIRRLHSNQKTYDSTN